MLKCGVETAASNLGAPKHTRVSFADTAVRTTSCPVMGGLTPEAAVWRLDDELTVAAVDTAPRGALAVVSMDSMAPAPLLVCPFWGQEGTWRIPVAPTGQRGWDSDT